jgi:acyl-[acyl-carrier-protein]-phospholipid O-acyltransferase / long-chain-fatty-acid--[acyl-carrier-protein] ligase
LTTLSQLLLSKRFGAMIACTCLSAFNQNYFKNAFTILLTYQLADSSGYSAETLISIASALFIIPFFLFSGIAGNIADRYPKQSVVNILKIIEIILYIAAFAAIAQGSVTFMLIVLALIGTQATFFSPVKYAILPVLLKDDEMIAGNGINEAGTYISILFGTMLGGLLILKENGAYYVGIPMILLAILGVWAAKNVPKQDRGNPNLPLSLNPFSTSWVMLKSAYANKRIWAGILGISWFWTLGALYLMQLPIFGKNILGVNEEVVTYLYALFSIGIGIGSLLCHILLRGAVRMTYVPWAILGMSLCGADMWWATTGMLHTGDSYQGFADFFDTLIEWRISFDFLMMSVFGGMFIVPLYTMLQVESAEHERSRAIASNNIVNAFFIALSALLMAQAYSLGADVRGIFIAAALVNLPVVWLIWKYVK